MPVVNRDVERQIVQTAMQRGMNEEQIKQAVQTYRQQAGGGQQNVSQETSQSQSVFGSVPEQLAIGAGKGILSTLSGASSLGEKIIQGIGRAITPKSLEATFGFAPQEQTSAQQLQAQAERAMGAASGSLTTPEGTAQKIGFGAEQIGEFLIPGGAGLKVGRAAEAAVGGGRLLRGATRLGATAAAEAGLAGGQTAIQQGGLNKEVAQAAAFGAATPIAGAALGRITKGIGSSIAESLGRTTGAGKASIIEAFNNPNVVKFAREAGSNADEMLKRTADDAKSALSSIYKSRSSQYIRQLNQIKADPTELDGILRSVRDEVVDLAKEFDVKFVEGSKLNNLDFSVSTITRNENVVQKAVNTVMSWTDTSAAGMDTLKKKLFQFAKEIPATEHGGARVFVNNLAHNVDRGLKTSIPGYQKMTSAYNQVGDLINDIERSLSLGKKSQVETTVRKLAQTLRRDDDTRREFLKVLSQRGNNDLQAQIAGAMLSKTVPRGLTGSGILGGAGIMSLTNPATIFSLLPVMMATSPRVVAEFTSLLGKITKPMIESKTISTQLQREFRQLFIKMIEDESAE